MQCEEYYGPLLSDCVNQNTMELLRTPVEAIRWEHVSQECDAVADCNLPRHPQMLRDFAAAQPNTNSNLANLQSNKLITWHRI